MWIPVYDCPECGYTWEVTVEERVIDDFNDSENEDTTDCLLCKICGSEVLNQKKDENGDLLYHLISDEDMEEDEKNTIYGSLLDETYIDDDELNHFPDEFYEDE